LTVTWIVVRDAEAIPVHVMMRRRKRRREPKLTILLRWVTINLGDEMTTNKDYRLTPGLKGLEWLLTGSSISASFYLSLGNWEAFYLFLVANLSGMLLYYKTKWWPSFLRQCLFLATTITGIWNNLL
jgi:hypothetical protein